MSREKTEDIASKCAGFFNNGYGYACSESVLLGFKDRLGEAGSIVPQIATPFGGGIAGNGHICGALLSSLMILGLKHGRTESNADRTALYEKTNNIIAKFKEKYGTINCGEIRMIPSIIFNDPVKLKKLKNSYHEIVCSDLIKDVAEWLLEEL